MKKKYFYHSLVETSDISIELAELNLSPDERVHLTSLVEANIHSSVVITVLSSLSKEEKKIFLRNLVSQNHKTTWNHLKTNVSEIEDKIKNSINEVKAQLKKDIKSAKKIK